MRERVLDRLAAAAGAIRTDRSRCLRMRFNGNGCSECISICHSGAISMEEDVLIDPGLCSECMLCMSACPTDCFSAESIDFPGVLARLRRLGNSVHIPVLGCSMGRGISAHVRIPCLGFLSHEHLLALAVFSDSGLQINMTGCCDCRNSFIADIVRDRLGEVEAESRIAVSERIRIVTDREALDYRDATYDRRGFFSAFKQATCRQLAGFLEDGGPAVPLQSYSAKKLPLRRELLNRVLISLNGKGDGLLKGFYHSVAINDDCTNCFACVGICPTGALKVGGCDIDEMSHLTFNSSLCSGCGLCRDICFSNALEIGKGFSGRDPFRFMAVVKAGG